MHASTCQNVQKVYEHKHQWKAVFSVLSRDGILLCDFHDADDALKCSLSENKCVNFK